MVVTKTPILSVLATCCLVGTATAQPSASAVLRESYEISKTAASEAEYNEIIDKIQGLDIEASTPAVRAYAEQLLAWALNRRGEKRWDRMQSIDDADAIAAIKDFELSLSLDPDRWRAKQNIAFVYATRGELKKADEILTEVIAVKPDHANAHFNRGELRYEIGSIEDAISDYSKAIELSPDEADFFTSRAHALFQLKRIGAAVADYRRAYRLDAANPLRALNYADALQSVGRWAEAEDLYRLATGLQSDSVRAQLNLAWLLATAGDAQRRNAREALSIVESLQDVPDGEQFRYIDTHAAALAAAGEYQSAVEVAQSGHSLAPAAEKDAFAQRVSAYAANKPYFQPQPQVKLPPSPSELRPNRLRD